jgi:hypothetical protein
MHSAKVTHDGATYWLSNLKQMLNMTSDRRLSPEINCRFNVTAEGAYLFCTLIFYYRKIGPHRGGTAVERRDFPLAF